MKALRWLTGAVGVVAILVTVLPLIPSNEAWIRIWDFPRIQIAVVLSVVVVAAAMAFPLRGRGLAFLAIAAAALAWQCYSIWPYTPLHPTEAKATPECDAGSSVRLFVANVLLHNRDAMPLLSLVDEVSPDLVLLVETDAWWDRQLEPLAAAFPYKVAQPQENTYGMHLFSRFQMIEPEVRFLVEDNVPSLKTQLMLPTGARINFYGLHPKPPPKHDTEDRDAELLIVGMEVQEEGAPSIVAGDMNDVAWSQSNSLFQEISGLLDPRIGRGPHSTFNANWPVLRWPLDHVFFEESFTLLDIAVMRDIGSDHFPFFVALCHDAAAADIQAKPQPEPSDLEAAEEAIEEGRDASGE